MMWFYGLVLGGALFGLMLLGKIAGNALRKSAEQQLQASAELLAQECKKGIGYKLNQLRLLASLDQMAEAAASETDASRLARAFIKDLVKYEGGRRSVHLFNTAGVCVACDDPIGNSETNEAIFQLPCVQAALSGTPNIGATVISRATGRPVLPMAVPVQQGNAIIGALWSSIDMGTLEKYMFGPEQKSRAGRSYLVLLQSTSTDRQSLQIPDLNPAWNPPQPAVQQALQIAPGNTYHFVKKDGQDLLFASAPVTGTSWMVVVSRSMQEILAPVHLLQKIVMIILPLLLGLLFGITQRLLSPVIRGIEECQRFSGRIQAGDLDKRIKLYTHDEVGELADGLNEMAATLEYNQTERELARQSEETLRQTQRLLSEAEMHMLRFQLNPHFLFNALNSVNVLVAHQPQQAQAMIRRLADFCRATLLLPDNGLASVQSETELLDHYLAIERMRWSDRVQTDVKVDAGLESVCIPVFTLQLLVENAIKYGQLSGADPLKICVHIYTVKEAVYIEVANTGRWFESEERPDSAGVGLTNLRNRLAAICGPETDLTTHETDGWVTVRIQLPAQSVEKKEQKS
jgi:sensor histidine kinase YesM